MPRLRPSLRDGTGPNGIILYRGYPARWVLIDEVEDLGLSVPRYAHNRCSESGYFPAQTGNNRCRIGSYTNSLEVRSTFLELR
jgi:hypothetical protein